MEQTEAKTATVSKTIERTIERVVSGITQTDLDKVSTDINSKLLSEIETLKKLIEQRSKENFSAIALSNRINTLSGVTLTNPTISGTIGNLDDSMIPDNITVSNYLPLSGGTLSGALTATNLVFTQSSSTRLSVFDQIWIGGNSTTTIRGDGFASIIPFASTTAITVSGTASSTNLVVSNLFSTLYASSSILTVSGLASTTELIVSGSATSTFSNPLASYAGNFIIHSAGTSNNLLFNPYGGNIGFGTSTPRGFFGLNDPAGIDSFIIGSGTPKFIVKDTGYIGIGTSTPAYALDVFGTLRIDPANGLIIPFSADPPTLNAAGKIGIDTTDDQFLYYGSATRTLAYTFEKCFALESPATDDLNIPIWSPIDAITVTSQYCRTEGGTSASVIISDGTNAMETIVCDSDGQADDGSLTNNTFSANERVEFDISAVSGAVTWVNFCNRYTIDRQ